MSAEVVFGDVLFLYFHNSRHPKFKNRTISTARFLLAGFFFRCSEIVRCIQTQSQLIIGNTDIYSSIRSIGIGKSSPAPYAKPIVGKSGFIYRKIYSAHAYNKCWSATPFGRMSATFSNPYYIFYEGHFRW